MKTGPDLDAVRSRELQPNIVGHRLAIVPSGRGLVQVDRDELHPQRVEAVVERDPAACHRAPRRAVVLSQRERARGHRRTASPGGAGGASNADATNLPHPLPSPRGGRGGMYSCQVHDRSANWLLGGFNGRTWQEFADQYIGVAARDVPRQHRRDPLALRHRCSSALLGGSRPRGPRVRRRVRACTCVIIIILFKRLPATILK